MLLLLKYLLHHSGPQGRRTCRKSNDEGTQVWWCDCHHTPLCGKPCTWVGMDKQRPTEVGCSCSYSSFMKTGTMNY